MGQTHFSSIHGRVRTATSVSAQPSATNAGEVWFDSTHNSLMVYDGSVWRGIAMTSTSTSTSSSTSTTTTA